VPKQNRVTPWGEIITTSARGMLMGNRGCLHDAQQQIRRLYQSKRWIICRLDFKGRHRLVMAPGLYTELFFLDEATALAAGHRPCAECSRGRFDLFRALWTRANSKLAGRRKPSAPFIDNVLHHERLSAANEKITYEAPLSQLPNGSFITLDATTACYLVLNDNLLAWSPAGYTKKFSRPDDRVVRVLTPQSVVRTLALGYRAVIHSSAFKILT
jgi:hypothetical protein